jgi:hypothetical protein
VGTVARMAGEEIVIIAIRKWISFLRRLWFGKGEIEHWGRGEKGENYLSGGVGFVKLTAFTA